MKVLLHICCGPCAIYPVQALKKEGLDVEGFFYNPNIHPKDEYERRLEAARKVAQELDFLLVAGDYAPGVIASLETSSASDLIVIQNGAAR